MLLIHKECPHPKFLILSIQQGDTIPKMKPLLTLDFPLHIQLLSPTCSWVLSGLGWTCPKSILIYSTSKFCRTLFQAIIPFRSLLQSCVNEFGGQIQRMTFSRGATNSVQFLEGIHSSIFSKFPHAYDWHATFESMHGRMRMVTGAIIGPQIVNHFWLQIGVLRTRLRVIFVSSQGQREKKCIC